MGYRNCESITYAHAEAYDHEIYTSGGTHRGKIIYAKIKSHYHGIHQIIQLLEQQSEQKRNGKIKYQFHWFSICQIFCHNCVLSYIVYQSKIRSFKFIFLTAIAYEFPFAVHWNFIQNLSGFTFSLRPHEFITQMTKKCNRVFSIKLLKFFRYFIKYLLPHLISHFLSSIPYLILCLYSLTYIS